MPAKTVYIREDDAWLWEWLVAEARRRQRSMSWVLARAIEALRSTPEGPDDD